MGSNTVRAIKTGTSFFHNNSGSSVRLGVYPVAGFSAQRERLAAAANRLLVVAELGQRPAHDVQRLCPRVAVLGPAEYRQRLASMLQGIAEPALFAERHGDREARPTDPFAVTR
jgi:hypothetical protein